MNRFIIIIFYVSLSMNMQAQTDVLKQHFQSIEKGATAFINKAQLQTFETDMNVISDLQAYLVAEQPKVAFESTQLMAKIGAAHQDETSRRTAVRALLNHAQTAPTTLLEKIAKGLQKFKAEDFDEVAIEQLKTVIAAKRPYLDLYIKLAGFLKQTDLLNQLKETYKEDKALYQSISVALVRSGDEKKMASLLRNIAKIKLNDDYIYNLVPLLVYTRQKKTTDILFDIILSDEKSCTHPGPDVEGTMICAYRVIEELAPYIKEFPVEVGVSGDLKVKSYPKALKTVRAWIMEHREDYELKEEIY